MATKKIKLLLNIGWQDANGLGLQDYTAEELAEGETIDVDDVQFDKLVNRMKVAVAYDPSKERKTSRGTPVKATARERFGNTPPPPMGNDEHLEDVSEDETEEDSDVEETSPVADENAAQAIEEISRMRSAEKLQSIADTDPRRTVQEAAKRRLSEL